MAAMGKAYYDPKKKMAVYELTPEAKFNPPAGPLPPNTKEYFANQAATSSAAAPRQNPLIPTDASQVPIADKLKGGSTAAPTNRILSFAKTLEPGFTPEQFGGITQAELDEATKAGINVFDPKVLRKMSQIDQLAAQEALSAEERRAMLNSLEGLKDEDVTDQLSKEFLTSLEEGKPGETTTKFFKLLGATASEELTKQGKAIVDIISLANKLTGGVINPDAKLPSTKATEDVLNKAMEALKEDLTLVKTGLKDPQEVLIYFKQMNNAISELERKQKFVGTNPKSLKYWLADGRVIEQDLIIFRDELKNLQNDFIRGAAFVP